MSIGDVKHQDEAFAMLQLALHGERLAHGYVFAGPAGVGKGLAAREFAKILLCLDRRETKPPTGRGPQSWFDSCGTCDSCRVLEANTHPDYHLIYKELVTTIPGKEKHKATELGIDVIRTELIEKVGRHPGLSRAKVFVVLEAHKLSRAAQNAMLKTLEEPPPNTYIILITEQLSALLPTTRSRAQTVRFGLLPEPFVRQRLAAAGADEARQRFFARLAPGQLGPALELLGQGVYDLNERLGHDLAALELSGADNLVQWLVEQNKELVEKMQSTSADQQTAAASESELARLGCVEFLGLVAGFYQDALRRKVGLTENGIINIDHIQFVNNITERLTLEQLQERINQIRQTQTYLDGNVNQNLLLTGLLARLAG